MSDSNFGDADPISSIRIGHRKISELSVREQMEARKQLELSEEERKKREILQRYPRYKVPGLEAGIREAHENIKRFEAALAKERKTIEEFTAFLALSRQRDRELVAAGFKPL